MLPGAVSSASTRIHLNAALPHFTVRYRRFPKGMKTHMTSVQAPCRRPGKPFLLKGFAQKKVSGTSRASCRSPRPCGRSSPRSPVHAGDDLAQRVRGAGRIQFRLGRALALRGGGGPIGCPVRASQNQAVPSSLPVRTVRPSGLKAAARTFPGDAPGSELPPS